MSSQIPDVIIAGYFRDGQWEFSLMRAMMVYACASPCEQPAAQRRRKAKRAPVAKCPCSKSLKFALGALCASKLECKTLQIEEGFLLRLRNIRLLSCCRVAGEQFGRLEHWCALVERTGVPNIVLYICSEKQFFVVSSTRKQTQPVDTRSAICWLREGAGLGFCVDEERGGVFRIDVSRDFLSDGEDPWREGLATLLSSLSVVFEACTFFDES